MLAVAIYVVLRVVAVFSVAGNWDEFVLLKRATDTAASGVLRGGGRPGLATLVLVPLAADCDDEITTLRHARLLWTGVTLGLLAGLGCLLGQVCDSRSRRNDVWLGVGLLALVPAFLEWSLQVRTDQLALALGLWGGVALLASQRRPGLAAAAGLLLGLAYLATQKAVYVTALVAVLAAGQLWRARELRPRREVLRVAACACAFAAVIGAFQIVTTQVLEVPPQTSTLESMTPRVISQQISEFSYYRNTIGFSQYLEILPTLVPHALLLAALAGATVASVRMRRKQKPRPLDRLGADRRRPRRRRVPRVGLRLLLDDAGTLSCSRPRRCGRSNSPHSDGAPRRYRASGDGWPVADPRHPGARAHGGARHRHPVGAAREPPPSCTATSTPRTPASTRSTRRSAAARRIRSGSTFRR